MTIKANITGFTVKRCQVSWCLKSAVRREITIECQEVACVCYEWVSIYEKLSLSHMVANVQMTSLDTPQDKFIFSGLFRHHRDHYQSFFLVNKLHKENCIAVVTHLTVVFEGDWRNPKGLWNVSNILSNYSRNSLYKQGCGFVRSWRFLGGFLTTLGAGVVFFVLLRMSSWIIF